MMCKINVIFSATIWLLVDQTIKGLEEEHLLLLVLMTHISNAHQSLYYLHCTTLLWFQQLLQISAARCPCSTSQAVSKKWIALCQHFQNHLWQQGLSAWCWWHNLSIVTIAASSLLCLLNSLQFTLHVERMFCLIYLYGV